GGLRVRRHPEGELGPVGTGRDRALTGDDDRVLRRRRRSAAGARGAGRENGENGSDDGQRLHAEFIRRRPDAVSHRAVFELVTFHTQSPRPGSKQEWNSSSTGVRPAPAAPARAGGG